MQLSYQRHDSNQFCQFRSLTIAPTPGLYLLTVSVIVSSTCNSFQVLRNNLLLYSILSCVINNQLHHVKYDFSYSVRVLSLWI